MQSCIHVSVLLDRMPHGQSLSPPPWPPHPLRTQAPWRPRPHPGLTLATPALGPHALRYTVSALGRLLPPGLPPATCAGAPVWAPPENRAPLPVFAWALGAVHTRCSPLLRSHRATLRSKHGEEARVRKPQRHTPHLAQHRGQRRPPADQVPAVHG
uniref:Uncharacterized protein n=1 Tax=Pipistrellus kuhlii TaxID=59472 RepID=A0A7J7RG57_PIPKU|nr:hypothetical protein mPipKuh1_010557 [Pipistrellus kuhlii]